MPNLNGNIEEQTNEIADYFGLGNNVFCDKDGFLTFNKNLNMRIGRLHSFEVIKPQISIACFHNSCQTNVFDCKNIELLLRISFYSHAQDALSSDYKLIGLDAGFDYHDETCVMPFFFDEYGYLTNRYRKNKSSQQVASSLSIIENYAFDCSSVHRYVDFRLMVDLDVVKNYNPKAIQDKFKMQIEIKEAKIEAAKKAAEVKKQNDIIPQKRLTFIDI